MKDGATKQREYRERRAAKLERLGRADAALTAIIAKLDGNTKPLAVEVRNMAMEALR